MRNRDFMPRARPVACVAGVLLVTLGAGQAIGQACRGGEPLVAIEPALHVNVSAYNDHHDRCVQQGKCIFSFRKTIEALITSSGKPFNRQSEQAFLESLAASLHRSAAGGPMRDETFVVENGESLLRTPVRAIFSGMSIKQFRQGGAEFSDDVEYVFRPLAIFNRIDKMRGDFAHCGEHRIVYQARINGKKFNLILEGAMMPNALRGEDREQGCRDIASFWTSLPQGKVVSNRNVPSAETADRLEALFYSGTASFKPAGQPGVRVRLDQPLVDYRNYGSGLTGQVRANIKLPISGWQMREWRLIVGDDTFLRFGLQTLKQNPFAELFRDSYSIDRAPWALNPDDRPADWATDNRQIFEREQLHLKLTLAGHLVPLNVVPDTEYANKLNGFLDANRCLRSSFKFDDQDLKYSLVQAIDIATLSHPVDDRFNEFQSRVQFNPDHEGYSDIFAGFPDLSTVRALAAANLDILKALGRVPASVTADHVLNRAYFASCAGCHAPPPAVGDLGNGLRAPKKNDFVHVTSAGQASTLLRNVLLPFRQIVLSHFLFETDREPVAFASRQRPQLKLQFRADGIRLSDFQLLGLLSTLQQRIKSFDAGVGRIDAIRRSEVLIQQLRSRDRAAAGALIPFRRPH